MMMIEKRFDKIEAIQRVSTAISKGIPENDLKHSYEEVIDRSKRCIKAVGNCFEQNSRL